MNAKIKLYNNFRGRVGGMKCAKRNSRRCSDVNVPRGLIAGALECTTMPCVP